MLNFIIFNGFSDTENGSDNNENAMPNTDDIDITKPALKALPGAEEHYKKHPEYKALLDQAIASIMVGPCPQCGSSQTEDCEEVEPYLDICSGHCEDCGNVWDLEQEED